MKKTEIMLPELALIAGTRAMLGAGAGLLLADRLEEAPRRNLGRMLLMVGLISTIPLGMKVLGGARPCPKRR